MMRWIAIVVAACTLSAQAALAKPKAKSKKTAAPKVAVDPRLNLSLDEGMGIPFGSTWAQVWESLKTKQLKDSLPSEPKCADADLGCRWTYTQISIKGDSTERQLYVNSLALMGSPILKLDLQFAAGGLQGVQAELAPGSLEIAKQWTAEAQNKNFWPKTVRFGVKIRPNFVKVPAGSLVPKGPEVRSCSVFLVMASIPV
jgi:hypothetical protein